MVQHSRMWIGSAVAAGAASFGDEKTAMLQASKIQSLSMAHNHRSSGNRKGQMQSAESVSHGKELAFVQNLAEKLAQTHGKIDTDAAAALEAIGDVLENSLRLINGSHTTDQGLVNDQHQQAQSCVTVFHQAANTNAQSRVTAAGLGTTHSQCRTTLGDVVDDRDTKCNALNQYLDNVVPPACTFPATGGEQAVEEYFASHNSFYETNYDHWRGLQTDCNNAVGLGSSTEVTCDGDQTTYENAMCALELAVMSACAIYDSCYTATSADYDSVTTSTGAQADTRKVEYTAAEKIKCYIRILLGEDEVTMDAINVCKELTPDVSHLDINVPPLPPVQTCDTSYIQDIPCTDAFEAAYQGMHGIDACNPCPALPDFVTGGGGSGGGGSIVDGQCCFSYNTEAWSGGVQRGLDTELGRVTSVEDCVNRAINGGYEYMALECASAGPDLVVISAVCFVGNSITCPAGNIVPMKECAGDIREVADTPPFHRTGGTNACGYSAAPDPANQDLTMEYNGHRIPAGGWMREAVYRIADLPTVTTR